MFFEPGQHRRMGLSRDPFKALVAPRPIAWVSTLGPQGIVNLAPFSFFNAVAERPPIVYFSPNGPSAHGKVKDTLRNVEDAGEFVVNIATWDLREAMNATSASLPPQESEAERVGLALVPCRFVKVPRIEASPVALECRHLRTLVLPSDDAAGGNSMVLGQVVGIHIDDAVVDCEGRVDLLRYKPIARLGYMDYAVVERSFAMQRPD